MQRSRLRRAPPWAVVILALGAIALVATTAFGQTQEDKRKCTLKNDAHFPGPGQIPSVKLQPAPNSQIRVVNFGNDRDPEQVSFTVTADRELKTSQVKRFNLVADPILRTGKETAEWVAFNPPRFTEIRLSGDRKHLRFIACLNPPSNLPAGNYTGVITVDGPPGLEPTTVAITANAKNGTLFFWGVVGTLLLAGLVLLYKEVADTRLARIEEAKKGSEQDRKQASGWRPAFNSTVTNVGWVATTLFALGATFGALYAVWDNNPAWGEAGLVGSIIALVGVGLAAVGARTVFTPSTGKSPDKA